MAFSLEKEVQLIQKYPLVVKSGIVTQIIGLLIESLGPSVHLGEICTIYNKKNEAILCEVVGFKDNKVLLMSFGDLSHIAPGSEVYPSGQSQRIGVSEELCGRVLDALGNPLDDKGPIPIETYYPIMASPPHVLERKLISDAFETRIKAIDGLCTIGKGQRMGVFSGSGLGKSILLAMIAKMSKADVNVIALIGERGREVKEFIERELGPEGLAKSIIIVATSDQAALLRVKGAYVATAIAEYFRDKGKDVVFMMDSITRYAMALREIGLAVGEPPTARGYTPSVFAMLPKLLERAGNAKIGSITGIYSILLEADDINDPIGDTVRALLDGHIILSRKLASANHYPAIDVLASISRVMASVTSKDHYRLAGKLKNILQTYKEAEDLINMGAYAIGSNPEIDEAIKYIVPIKAFLKQDMSEFIEFNQTVKELKNLIHPDIL